MKASLKINGFEIELGSNTLETFLSELAGPGVLEKKALLLDLAKNGSIGIRQTIASNRPMPKEVFDILVGLDDNLVSSSLIANEEASRFYNKEMLDRIVSADNVNVLCTLVTNLESFSHIEGIQEIIEALFTHKEYSVRWSFIDNSVTTDDMYQKLANDHDADIRLEAAGYLEQFKE